MGGLPKFLDFFQDRSDKKHELDLAKMQTGQVMVIVRTVNETLAMQRERQELSNHCIWSMEELEVIFNDPLVQEIIKVKAFDPTAKVVSFKANKIGGESGFDDFPDEKHYGYCL